MKANTTVDVQEAWSDYKRTKGRAARDFLIRHYSYLVKITAGRVVSGLPPSMDREDLISAGAMGLIKAIDQFDITRQVKFETYAIALIRGGILEMLREDDWVPRSVREKCKVLERACVALETELSRPPTEAEIQARLELTTEELNKLLHDAGRTSLLSMEDVLVGSEGNEKLHLSDVIQDDAGGPNFEAEIQERRRLLGKSIDRLPERERLVIALYYYEGLTFKEIGKTLTISESRVYQLHTQAVVRMRGYLQRDDELFRA